MTPLHDSRQRAAATLVVALSVALAIALTPYATGLLGIPVLYIVLEPVHEWLKRRAPPKAAASLVVAVLLLVLIVVGGFSVGLIVSEAQRIEATVMQSPIVARLSELKIGGFDVGARLADLGSKVVAWIGSSAFGFIGTASRAALNLTISCFGLYYLLLQPGETWNAVRPYIPFSARNTEKLSQQFRDITTSTVIGTGLSALLHGVLTSLGFWIVGLPNATLWGAVTIVFSILPVLGSGLVWGPGDRAAGQSSTRSGRRARALGDTDRGEHRLRDPADGVPAVGTHPPVGHPHRGTGRSPVPGDPRSSHWTAGGVVLL